MSVDDWLILCGVNILFLGLLALPLVLIVRAIRKRRKEKLTGTPSAVEIKQRQEDWLSFAAVEAVTEEELSSRPVSATLVKLIGGTLIVGIATYLGSFVSLGSSDGSGLSSRNASFIGCAVGLWLVQRWIFGNSDPLDKRRWQHHWHGDLVGYWPTHLLLVAVLTGLVSSGGYYTQGTLIAMDLGAYVTASVVGLFAGLLNVFRCDAADKREVTALFQEWQKDKLVRREEK